MVKNKAVQFVLVAGICCIGVFLFLGAKVLIDQAPAARVSLRAAASLNSTNSVASPDSAASPDNAASPDKAASQNGPDTLESTVPQNAKVSLENAIEIREKMFIAQTNEIYLNFDDYAGKTIRLEGLFKTDRYYEDAEPYCFVLRYGPGCCGYDGTAGFEVSWMPRTGTPGSPSDVVLAPPYPNEDDWVEAVGTLSSYDENGYPYPYIQLTSLTVKEQRGVEFVTQ
jgi:uncharacterized membrane protein YcgQ (UPF0703/DUF1980 family)